jgi:hypothetical protein
MSVVRSQHGLMDGTGLELGGSNTRFVGNADGVSVDDGISNANCEGFIVIDALGDGRGVSVGVVEGQMNVPGVHCIRVGSQHCTRVGRGLGAGLREDIGVRVGVTEGQMNWSTLHCIRVGSQQGRKDS